MDAAIDIRVCRSVASGINYKGDVQAMKSSNLLLKLKVSWWSSVVAATEPLQENYALSYAKRLPKNCC